jgi:glycosyltransferase involved in cell wall biosynthesis
MVIPCLNEVNTIEKAVSQAQNALKLIGITSAEIIVVDNGSIDGSVEKVIKQDIARVIRMPTRGYGAALRRGIMKAKSQYVFFADADLSYDFLEIKKFIPLVQKNYDLILGSRFKGRITKGAMPFLNRYLGTPLLTFLIKIMYGIKTSDCNSGMRMIKKDFYKKLNMRNSGMEWASELLIKTAMAGGKYAEVPINFYKDKRGSEPHLLRWTDGLRHLRTIILIKVYYGKTRV